MKAAAFLDRLVILLFGGLLVCLGMLLYNLHELEKAEAQLETRNTVRSHKVDKRLEEMLIEMELESEERAGTRATKSGTEESP